MFTTQNGDISPQKSREICKWFNIKNIFKKRLFWKVNLKLQALNVFKVLKIWTRFTNKKKSVNVTNVAVLFTRRHNVFCGYHNLVRNKGNGDGVWCLHVCSDLKCNSA